MFVWGYTLNAVHKQGHLLDQDLGIKIPKVQHMHACTCTCNAVSCSQYTQSHMHMHALDKHVGVHALHVDAHGDDVLQVV